MKEITAVIVLAVIFVGLGFAIGRFTAPGSLEDYKVAIKSLVKENEIQRKLVQTYMIMYEKLLFRINDLMSGKYYPPDVPIRDNDL